MTVREVEPSDTPAIIALDTPVASCRVREADTNDIDDLMPLVRQHWPLLPWGQVPLDEQRIRRLFVWAMTTLGCAAWVIVDGTKPVGFLALSIFPNIYTGELQASNPWWYVAESVRGTRASLRLLRTAEQWASEQGATMTLSVHDEKVGAMLERMQYQKIETAYRKGA